MFRIAICEDNSHEIEVLLSQLAKFQASHPGIHFSIHSFENGYDLLENIAEGGIYDLFLLDVILPNINGIELTKRLRIKNPDVPVIFLTSSADYALSAYNVSAVQYMLKPVEEEGLFSVLEHLLSIRKQKIEKYFILSTPESNLKISYSSIIYIEITGHVLKVCLNNGDTLTSKNIRVPFKTAIAALLEDNRFLYAHKSYLINMDFVQELKGKTFTMCGGCVIPIPKYRIADAKERYFNYLSDCGIGHVGG